MKHARCAFLTNGPDGDMPAKQYANYDGPVPPETCEHFCSRFIDCAKSGMFFPVPVGDARRMFAYLDREAVEARRERNYRRTLRKLPPKLRRFVRVLRRVLEDVPGPETEHRKKVCKVLKIKDRMYLYLLRALRENVL